MVALDQSETGMATAVAESCWEETAQREWKGIAVDLQHNLVIRKKRIKGSGVRGTRNSGGHLGVPPGIIELRFLSK